MDVELPKGRHRLDASTATQDEVRNLALAVLQQWGPSRTSAVAERLTQFVTGITGPAAAAAEQDALAAEQAGNVYAGNHTPPVADDLDHGDVEAAIRAAAPWIDADNLGHLVSQSSYYARMG